MASKILVVDDERYVRDLLVKILTRQGHEVRGVADGETALRVLSEQDWDVVLTDVVMPGIDGFDLLRRIKGGTPGVKVIVLTGFARRQSISDFLLYGADEYLAKPFQVHELMAAVGRVLASRDAATPA
jgi:DNA-binding response OmpR family regulator